MRQTFCVYDGLMRPTRRLGRLGVLQAESGVKVLANFLKKIMISIIPLWDDKTWNKS